MDDSERRKAVELLKEMRNENNVDDGNSSNQGARLNWMYKGPSDLVDREEYLLGKTIDRTFEILNTGGNSDVVGRIGEQSNVPKRLLEKTGSTEQVDIAKKILEDPLYAIKQKEMEARKKLLNNPVKLKQIKQMLLERNKQNSVHKKKKKKIKRKSEEHLNLLILNKLRKFTDKEKRKALNKIMQSDSSSCESDSSYSKEKKSKTKRRSSSSSDESDSSSETTDRSDEDQRTQKNREKKGKHKKKVKNNKNKSSSGLDSSHNKGKERSHNKKVEHKKHPRKSSSSSDSTSPDVSEKNRKSESKTCNWKARPERRDSRGRSRRSRSNERENKYRRMSKKDDHSTEKRRSTKTYGLMMPDGSKPEMKGQASPVRKYEKNAEVKPKYVPPPKEKPLSEKEREKRLKEMMENAQQRKEDREKNLASHRKKLDQEEEFKSYDDDFMRRQMLHLTSQGTMADRIKSNINNIQRSKSSMDSNFMKK